MTIPRRVLHPLVAALLALAPAAGADPLARADVEAALAGFEHAPAPAAVRAWGDPGARWLAEIGRDPAAPAHVRVRALRALGAFRGDASVRAVLRATAAAEGGLFLKRACLDALVEGFDDVAEVARYLGDADALVRDGAAWALAASPSTAAREALAGRLRVETDPTVRATLTEALARPATPPAVAPSAPPAVTTAAPRVRAVRRR